MSQVTTSNEAFALELEDKVLRLANHIKSLKEVVREAEDRATVSEQKVCNLNNELVQTEKEKSELMKSMVALKTQFEHEKADFEEKIETHGSEIGAMKEESNKKYEAAVQEHANNVSTMEVRIFELKEELQKSQEECVECKKLVEELQTKTTNLEERLQKESEDRQHSENVAAMSMSKLKEDSAKELEKLGAVKDKELEEAEGNFKKLEGLYREQSELIEKYEIERASISKIAMLGVNVMGENTKESVKKLAVRGRGLGREASSRGRSLVRDARSRSRSLVRRPVVQSQTECDEFKDTHNDQRDTLDPVETKSLTKGFREGLPVVTRKVKSKKSITAFIMKKTTKPIENPEACAE
mmetsp:Transcript_17240/g.38887  ORF Transcript_17240/g.38887 Transcript_17240/m.38887 type:complete len:355 (-) Transcript_17240:269-1333(-)